MRIAVCVIALCVLPIAGQERGSNGVALRPAATFKGVIKTVDGTKIQLEMPDGNFMDFRATRKSKIQVAGKDAKLKDLSSGQTAEIDGRYVLGTVEAVRISAKPQPEALP